MFGRVEISNLVPRKKRGTGSTKFAHYFLNIEPVCRRSGNRL